MSRLTPGSPGNFSTGGGGSSSTITNLVGITVLGQTTMAASLPVTIASNQSANALWGHGVTGATVPANAQYVGGLNSDGTLRGFYTAKGALNNYSGTDGTNVLATAIFAGNKDNGWKRIEILDSDSDVVTPGNFPALMTYGFNTTFNGTSWSRLREVVNATDSTGTGIQASGLLAQFDDVAPTTVTENRFGNLRMNSARQLYTQPVKIDTFGATTAFTITLASLASSVAGVGRQSTLITGNTASSAMIAVKFTVGTTPTANTLIYVYLIRGDGTINDDNAGATDAGLTVINAPLLGTILVPAATSNTAYYGVFDTKFLGSLGPTFGIAVVNSTGATANATGGNFTAEYTKIT